MVQRTAVLALLPGLAAGLMTMTTPHSPKAATPRIMAWSSISLCLTHISVAHPPQVAFSRRGFLHTSAAAAPALAALSAPHVAVAASTTAAGAGVLGTWKVTTSPPRTRACLPLFFVWRTNVAFAPVPTHLPSILPRSRRAH